MNCPNCGIHWIGFIGGGPNTISGGYCMRCGYDCMVDLVQLVIESDKSQSKKCNLDPATKKPPEGLRPRAIVDAKRKLEIEEALWRYIAAEKAIPCKWVQEYLDLLQKP